MSDIMKMFSEGFANLDQETLEKHRKELSETSDPNRKKRIQLKIDDLEKRIQNAERTVEDSGSMAEALDKKNKAYAEAEARRKGIQTKAIMPDGRTVDISKVDRLK